MNAEDSYPSNTVSITPGNVNPPTNLSITSVTTSSVSLSWTASTTEYAGYKVFRNSSEINETLNLSYTDNSVTTGQTYEYYVVATLNGEDSSPSNTVSTTIPSGSSNPNLQLSTNQLVFDSTQVEKPFTGYNIGGGTMEWDMVNRNGTEWMSVSPVGQGTGNFTATVMVDRSKMLLGTWSGYLDISGNGGYRIVKIDVTKVASGSPGLFVTPANMEFSSNITALDFNVYNNDSGILTWSAISSAAWLTLAQSSGTLGQNENAQITTTVNRSSLTAGVHSANIIFNSNAGEDTITVAVIKEGAPSGYEIAFQDDFERTEVGLNYQLNQSNGTIVIEDGRLKMSNMNGGGYVQAFVMANGTQSANMVATLDIDNGPSVRANQSTAIYIRYLDANNYYSFGIREDSYTTPKVTLAKTVNGVSTVLYELLGTMLGSGRYKISVVGDTLSATNITGTPLGISVVDGEISGAGRIGFYVGEETSYFDNVMVYVVPQPELAVSINTLDFGKSDTLLTCQLSNSGTGALDWTASSSENWLTNISPASGSLSAGNSSTIYVSVCRNDLIGGDYTGSIDISSNGGNGSLMVLITKDTSNVQTMVFYADPGDGHIYMKELGSWDIIHEASSSSLVDETYVRDSNGEETDFYCDRAGQNSPYEYEIARAFFPFNTANLPDNAQIISAELIVSIKHQTHNQTTSLGVVKTNQISASSLIDTDFDNCGAVDNPQEGASRLEYTAAEVNFVRRVFVLNSAGRSWISMTGYTNLGIRCALDMDDQAPTLPNRWSFRYAEYAGTADDPALEIKYAVDSLTTLTVNPDTVDFGASQTQLSFNISTDANWSLSHDSSWLSCDLATGTGNTAVMVTINRDNLGSGTQTALIRVATLDDTALVHVTVATVSPPQTASFYSESGDGHFYTKLVGGNWSTVRNAASSNDVNEMSIHYTQGEKDEFYSDRTGQSNYEYEQSRGFYAFNTASLPDAASITQATLTVSTLHQTHSVTISLCLVAGSQAGVNSLCDTDFDNRGSVDLAGRIVFSQAETNFSRRTFTLNSNGLNAISKTGYTKFAIISSQDQDNQAPVSNSRWTFRYSEYAGTAEDPVLEITYSQPLAKSIADNSKEQFQIPDEFKFCQNYPNPFNAATTISYELPVAATVTLEICNILGQRVALPADNIYREAGYYQAIWKPDNLPSGIYFCHIKVGRYEEVKKMILMR